MRCILRRSQFAFGDAHHITKEQVNNVAISSICRTCERRRASQNQRSSPPVFEVRSNERKQRLAPCSLQKLLGKDL
jgi:hypothetical protein